MRNGGYEKFKTRVGKEGTGRMKQSRKEVIIGEHQCKNSIGSSEFRKSISFSFRARILLNRTQGETD